MSFYIIIRGPLGCGKSTIAEKLQGIIRATVIPIDRILDDHHLTNEHEQGYISQKSFFKANEIAAQEAEKFLVMGAPVIFDGNFYWQSQIDDLIARLDFPHAVFTLKAPLGTCIQRDADREKKHGEDAAAAVYEKSVEFSYGIEIDATQPLDKCVRDILGEMSDAHLLDSRLEIKKAPGTFPTSL